MTSKPAFVTSRVMFKARVRTAFAAAAAASGAAWLWNRLVAQRGVRILAYHGVESPPTNTFAVSVDDFDAQIAHLARHYDVIDLATFLDWQAGRYCSPRPKIVLTFDDGFKNNMQLAAPVLRKHGLPATFFLIGAKLGGGDARFLTGAEAAELVRHDGFRAGSHTVNHLSLGRIARAQMEDEIARSKDLLEEVLDREVDLFCYPYGTFKDFNRDSAASLRRNGFAVACTSVNGVNFRKTDPMRLRRTKVEWSDDEKTFQRLIGGAMDGWIFVDFFLRFLQRPRAVRFDYERIGPAGDGQVKPWRTLGR